jgi:RNA-splicing ligase RtcB
VSRTDDKKALAQLAAKTRGDRGKIGTRRQRLSCADLGPSLTFLGTLVLCDVSHDTCKKEEHETAGQRWRLFIHRKGATPPFGVGQPTCRRPSPPPARRC